MRRLFSLLLSLSVVLLSFCVTPVFAGGSPQDQVREMVDGVFAVLNSDLDTETKKVKISGTVQGYLGVQSLSQRTLGVYWKQASEDEKKRFMGLYVQILEQTYLGRIEGYSGGRVDYLQERVKDDKAILDTKFVTEKVEIPVQYKMVLKTGNWQIYDVLIEGVSLVRSYRSTYSEILRKEGFTGLFGRMEEKLKEMKAA